jgi:hypothetical protein
LYFIGTVKIFTKLYFILTKLGPIFFRGMEEATGRRVEYRVLGLRIYFNIKEDRKFSGKEQSNFVVIESWFMTRPRPVAWGESWWGLGLGSEEHSFLLSIIPCHKISLVLSIRLLNQVSMPTSRVPDIKCM